MEKDLKRLNNGDLFSIFGIFISFPVILLLTIIEKILCIISTKYIFRLVLYSFILIVGYNWFLFSNHLTTMDFEKFKNISIHFSIIMLGYMLIVDGTEISNRVWKENKKELTFFKVLFSSYTMRAISGMFVIASTILSLQGYKIGIV